MAEINTAFGIAKLNNNNYQVWKFKIEKLLKREGTWKAIASPRLTTGEEAQDTWDQHDDKALGTICLLIEDTQISLIRNKTTAKEAWDALKEYHEKASGLNKFSLIVELLQLKYQDDEDMEKHVAKIQELIDNLTALGNRSAIEFGPWIILRSMPTSYHTLISVLASRPEDELTIDIVKATLISEFKRRKSLAQSEDYDSAMKANVSKAYIECYFCHEIGHMKTDCPKYISWKKRQRHKKAHARAVIENLSSDDEDDDDFQKSKPHQAYIATSRTCNTNWFLDSAASSHMTNNASFFDTIDTNYTFSVLVVNGQACKAYGIGQGRIECLTRQGKTTLLNLTNVLYVPNFDCNLISIGRLDKLGFHLKIMNNQMAIFTKTNEEIAVGDVIGQVYKLRKPEYAYSVLPQHPEDRVHHWHARFGHRDPKVIRHLSSNNLVTGIQINDCPIKQVCECCIKGKITRNPFPQKASSTTHRPLDLLHADLYGPMLTETPGGRRYIMTLIDDYSRYTYIFLSRRKSQVTEVIKNFIQFCITQFKTKPKAFRSDLGREYVNQELNEHLKHHGIKFQHTTLYTPEQNGVAERRNRYLVEAIRTMLIDAELPNKYWGEAALTAVYLQNRLPTRERTLTPYELLLNRKSDVKHLKELGCKAYAHIPKQKRNKLNIKATECLLIGYLQDFTGYRLPERSSGKIIISRDVKFIEDSRVHGKDTDKTDLYLEEKTLSSEKPEEIIYIPSNSSNELFKRSSGDEPRGSGEASTSHPRSSEDADDIPLIKRIEEISNEPPKDPSDHDEETEQDYQPNELNDDKEPRTIQQALSEPYAEQWSKAMAEELESLEQNETWDLEPIPRNKTAIGCKWVFKIKKTPGNAPDKFKARLVAQGFSQKFGKDFEEDFAPVVKTTTVRTLLSIAGKENLHVKHWDVKTAFLNGKLKETINMKQPPVREKKGQEEFGCRLNKSIYGLKQSAKSCNETLHETLTNYNFERCESDLCLYKHGNNTRSYLVVHVDDIMIASSKLSRINGVIQALGQEFTITDLGDIQCYLGLEVTKNQARNYFISQQNYIEKVLIQARLENAKFSNHPMDTNYEKNRVDSPEIKIDYYSKLIGKLLYIAINSRPNISAPVAILAQHITGTQKIDWNELQRICRYLKATKNYKLRLSSSSSNVQEFFGYADANWAEDQASRKSNTGYLFKSFNGTISWASKKQTCVSVSLTEAEIVSLSEASRECVLIRKLLEFLDHPQNSATIIFEDNQGCLSNIHAPGLNPRSKHIDTQYFYTRDLEEKGIIKATYCPTDVNQADILTKPLGPLDPRLQP